jgi:D-arabinose 1-dehydrogenase-like Zn-dependent alcohol dehydrogenase
VLAADRGDAKLEAARDAGADETIDALTGPIDAQARRLTDGRGVDVVVDFVASPETLQAGLAALAPGGRLAILGVHRDSRFTVDPFWMLNGEREVIGSRYVTRQEIVDSLELVRRGLIRPTVTRTFALEEAEQVHDLLGNGEMIGRAALVMD